MPVVGCQEPLVVRIRSSINAMEATTSRGKLRELIVKNQGNSDGQSNFNLILQKLSILKNDVSSNSIFVG